MIFATPKSLGTQTRVDLVEIHQPNHTEPAAENNS